MKSFKDFINSTEPSRRKQATIVNKDFGPIGQISSADPHGITRSQRRLLEAVKFDQNFRVIYSKSCKRISLERMLVSKLVWEPEEITLEEILIIFDNLLFLQEFCERDFNFYKKFGKSLEDLAKILKKVNFSETHNLLSKVQRAAKLIKRVLEGFLYPVRNYKNQYRLQRSLVQVKNFTLGVTVKQLPPKKVIGKGYTDKGTAKNPAIDGSPSWQEVAMSTSEVSNEK